MPEGVIFFGQRSPYSANALKSMLGRVPIVLVVEGKPRRADWTQHRLVKAPRTKTGTVSDPYSLQELAASRGIDCLVSRDINASRARRWLRSFEAEAMVCAGFDRLFTPGLLELFQFSVNLHPSLLPKWPGPSPLFWMAKTGDRQHGVSAHLLVEKEDAGPILGRSKLPYQAGWLGADLLKRLGDVSGNLFSGLWPRYRSGDLKSKAQNLQVKRSRARRPKPEDAEFRPEDWAAEDLAYFCNLAPFHRSPWTRLGDEIFFINRTIRVSLGGRIPGQYALLGKQLLVNCRDGVVELEVQVEASHG